MCVCVRVCALWKRGRSLCISIYVRRTILFPFIGGCGVCGEMSVAHFHTPIVSHSACTCGGCRPWLHFHHIIHGLCWDLERDCCECVCVCVGGDSVEVSFLHFSCEYSAGKRSALSWPSRRQRNSLILLAGKHIFQLTEAHRPLPFLRTPVADWRTKDSSAALGRMQESGRAETRAHPALIRRSSANTPITFLFISFFSDKACELFLSSPGVGTEQTWIFMCTDVCIFACLSTVTCGTEKGKETDTFSISISPSFRSLQTHNVLRLMCVRVGSSVCDCKGGGIGIGRKVKHYLTALCSDW